ncbi:MAG: two-component response regulator [Pedosphaera sp.]|nr:two-component response regulator [Pedosphaera sp.]
MTAPVKLNIILMAEDDSDDRLLAQDALVESGIATEVRFVENGVELMDYLHHRNKFSNDASCSRPSLIILDLNMPKKDGREALREIKSDPELRRIPVVVLTTSSADSDIARVYELGANSFISKPVAFNSLVSVMKSIGEYWFRVVLLPLKA